MLYFKTNPAPNIDLCIQHHFSCEAKALKRSVFDMAARNCSHPLKFEIFSSKNCKNAKCKWMFGKIDPRAWCQGKHIWSNFELLLKHCGTWVRILIFESYGKSYDGYQCLMLNICPILFYLCPVFEQNLLILTPFSNKKMIQFNIWFKTISGIIIKKIFNQ